MLAKCKMLKIKNHIQIKFLTFLYKWFMNNCITGSNQHIINIINYYKTTQLIYIYITNYTQTIMCTVKIQHVSS